MTKLNITQKAIAAAGGNAAVARHFNLTAWAVNKWGRALHGEGQVPAERVVALCELANTHEGVVLYTPEDLRPDVFGGATHD